jgi:hypothetical protein
VERELKLNPVIDHIYMRIIKDSPTGTPASVITTIAGEMINIETGVQHFLDGQFIDPTLRVDTIPCGGYPVMRHGDSVAFAIRGTAGYIYVPPGTNIAEFQNALIKEIDRLYYAEYRTAGNYLDARDTSRRVETSKNQDHHYLSAEAPLTNYQSIAPYSHHTNTKIKSSQALTDIVDRPGKKISNVKRALTETEGLGASTRFIWHFATIDKYSTSVTSMEMNSAIARIACSIFYDAEDVCMLPHNAITFSFSKADLRGHAAIIDETVNIFKYGDPLLLELSTYWRNRQLTVGDMRNVEADSVEKLLWKDRDALKLIAPLLDGSTTHRSDAICSKCRSVLWGDNYVLCRRVGDQRNPNGMAVCAPCLHTDLAEPTIESLYFELYRVRFHKTSEQVIADMKITPDKRALYKSIGEGIREYTAVVNKRSKHYKEEWGMCGIKVSATLIGKDFVAFNNINDFLFTNAFRDAEFVNRRVVTLM